MFEDADDNCQSNRHLGGGDGHNKENEDLPGCFAKVATDCDKGEVRRVEHQFNAHKNDDRIPADEDSDNADRKQERA